MPAEGSDDLEEDPWAQRVNLVYVGAFAHHIGFFPPVKDAKLRREAAAYAGPKGNLKFPLDEPIPYGLIAKIVKARVKEAGSKAGEKGKAKGRA